MRLTPTDRDRLLIFTAAELARTRRARGLRLNIPEATALIADTVCEAARDGARLMAAAAAGAAVLGPDDVLPGVVDVVTEPAVVGADDLTKLTGIGPKLAGLLAERGVTRFADIASWTAEDVAAFDKDMKLMGRIDREAWIAQARRYSGAQ